MAKEELLQQEYDNRQSYLRGNKEVSLYSKTKQQADRPLRSLGDHFNKNKTYPPALRNDAIRVEKKREAAWCKYWFNVPVASVWGGIYCPIEIPDNRSHLLDECELRETKLLWKGGHRILHIVVQKEVPEPLPNPSQPILAVDLGEVRPATAVLLKDGEMAACIMVDSKVREIRVHCDRLRRELGKNKCLDTIRKIGRRERRKVDAELHKLSKEVVEPARENNAIIIIGDLTGIRKNVQNKGKTSSSTRRMGRRPSGQDQ